MPSGLEKAQKKPALRKLVSKKTPALAAKRKEIRSNVKEAMALTMTPQPPPPKPKPKRVSREEKSDYSLGVIKGIESDNHVSNDELQLYRKALEVLNKRNTLKYLPKRTGIHATEEVRKAVGHLVPGRLTS